jgi:glutathione S-transferase
MHHLNRKRTKWGNPMLLHDMIKAPNPRRVRIFLSEKQIDVPRREVDIPGGANLAPDYLAINPRGVVPTLVLDDGRIIDESLAICRYFEVLHPEPNLFGRDAFEQAQVERWQRICEFDGMFSVAGIFRNTAAPFANRGGAGNVPALAQSPEIAARSRIMTMHWFERLNTRLGESAFVASDRYTIADITAMVTVDFARWVKIAIPDNHAHTRRWYAEVSARPSAKA